MASENLFVFLWAKQVRGLTIAEHAVLAVLAGFYDKPLGRARVSMGHLVWRFEASRIYLREVIHAIEKKGFIRLEENYNKKGLQETNSFKLSLDRWFPIGPDYELAMKFLKAHVRDIASDSHLAKGFSAAWIERLPKRHARNAMPRLYIAVSSPQHFEQLEENKFALQRKLKGVAPFEQYEIIPLRTYVDRRSDGEYPIAGM